MRKPQRTRTYVVSVATVVVLSAGCGTTALTPAASHASCHQQYEAWLKGPSKTALGAYRSAMLNLATAGEQQNLGAMRAALRQAGRVAAALKGHVMPHCADPAGYWTQELTLIRSVGRDTSTSSPRALFRQGTDLDKLAALQVKLTAELKKKVYARSG